MYFADISRNYIRSNTGEESLNDVIHTVSDIELKYKNSKEQEFILKTQNDEVLGKLLKYCKFGWLKSINEDGEQ
ncbi:Retrotransposable element Tf2 protein type 1 [Aphis craccivora]|uniref:Retrotransposable element Tf2 protein type 1 n=1 Tax=Aphis craccivora TaxID=307492 RepID=A0A6G0VTZ7_APHCR|nr:Retrotransposable element Tf2 protein type 1 [Aphis craccivora]